VDRRTVGFTFRFDSLCLIFVQLLICDFPSQISRMVSSAAQMFATNAQNHVVVNLPKRLLRWLAWKLEKELQFIENGDIWRLARAILDSLVEDVAFELPNSNFLLALTPAQLDQVDLRCQYIFTKAKDVVLEGMGLGDEVSGSWWKYLRPLWRILQTFEKNSRADAQERVTTRRRGRGLRTFSLLPLTSYQQRFVLIDTDTLFYLFVRVGWMGLDSPTMAEFKADSATWWKKAFRLDKATTANRRFGFSISTDGMSVSVNIKRKVAEPDGLNSHGFTENGSYVPLDIEGARVVGLDPGRRDLFRTAHGEEKGDGESCSVKEWREIAGVTRATKKRQTWIDNNANIKQIIRGKSSLYLYTHFYYF
jgi:hypothetical protein